LRNRLYDVTVDDSPTQDDEVARMQLEAAGHIKKYENMKEMQITCQAMMYIIKRQLFEVDIPYHNRIRASKHVTKDRRRLPRFIDMIRGFALLNFMQREFNEKGHLIATIDDFNAAKRLFEANVESQVTNLTQAELKLAKWIFDQSKHVSINDIVGGYSKPNGEKFNPESIRKTLQGTKTHEGLIAKLPGLLIDDSKREVKYYLPRLDIYGGELITLEEDKAIGETSNLALSCADSEKQNQEA